VAEEVVLCVDGVNGAGAVLKRLSSSSKAAWMLSVSGGKGEAGVGFRRACVRSRMAAMAAMARSFEELLGMTTLLGNHARVSTLRSAEVSLARRDNSGSVAWPGRDTSRGRRVVAMCRGQEASRGS
jgi:hypothetical protein